MKKLLPLAALVAFTTQADELSAKIAAIQTDSDVVGTMPAAEIAYRMALAPKVDVKGSISGFGKTTEYGVLADVGLSASVYYNFADRLSAVAGLRKGFGSMFREIPKGNDDLLSYGAGFEYELSRVTLSAGRIKHKFAQFEVTETIGGIDYDLTENLTLEARKHGSMYSVAIDYTF